MKILMAARRFPPDVRSGTETVFENLHARACRAHEVRLVVGFRRDRSLVPADAVAVDLRERSRVAGYAALSAAVAREVARWRPDVVLANSIEVPVLHRPTVCIVHDLNFGGDDSGARAAGRRAYYVVKTRRFKRVVTPSEAMRRHLAEAGLPERRLVAVHNGVDLERFRPPPETPRTDPRLVLAYPSRILPGKGQHLAIDAVARLTAEEKAGVVLRVVGTVADPEYLAHLRVLAEGQPVEFHLEVPDIVPWYQSADVVLFPTLMSEGFGFTAVEAMACGRPVIWSDQPAIREATGGLGVAVPPADVVALRGAIRRLRDAPEDRARLGRTGRAYAEGNYHWDTAWRRYERVLAEAAGRRGAP